MALTIAISLPDIGSRRSFVQTFGDIELFSSCFFFCAPEATSSYNPMESYIIMLFPLKTK